MRRVVIAAVTVILGSGGIAAAVSADATTTADPSGLIETVAAARSVYHVHDSAGHSMDTLKIVPDPSTSGRFLGVYHWATSSGYSVGVATSTDLRTWTYRRTLDSAASQPYLAFSPKNGPILAEEAYSPSHLRFEYWTSVANMLGTAAPYKTFDAAKTLSTCAEGTPDIRSVTYSSSGSTITSGSTIVVAHHYFANCQTDREAVGTLTNFKTWKTASLPAVDDRLSAAGAVGKHGDRDHFVVGGHTYELYEGAITAASAMSDWRNVLDDGTTARQVTPQTAGGSTAFANPTTTVATVGGVTSLIVTQYIPQSGAATGEAGELIYWNPITQPTPPTTSASSAPTTSASSAPSSAPTTSPIATTTSPIAPTSSSIAPTTSASSAPSSTAPSSTTPPAGITKTLVVVEENHSLSQMQSGMPYLYSLAQRFAYADHYTAITHPSEPNYVAIAFGSTMGDTADHSTAVSYPGPTVFSQALTNGRTAKTYAESMPSKCDTGTASPYYVKHNPWPFEATPGTSGCATGDVPAGSTSSGALVDDVKAGTLPNVGMLVPNICNDAHDCSLATADSWLHQWLPVIMAGPDYTSGHLAIVITADEDDRNSGNTVLTTVLARQLDGAHKVVSTPLTHYSLSRWLSELAGGQPLRNAQTAPDLAAAFGLS